MTSLADAVPKIEIITFDCYGTLIDWSAGLSNALRTVFDGHLSASTAELFDAYVRVEAEIESGPYQRYREVLTATAHRLAEHFEVTLSADRAELFADLLPRWKPFSDTVAALHRLKKKFQLGVLSNVDRDLFAGTNGRLKTVFDLIITADDVQSYKPGLGHFHHLLESHGKKETVLHVAQSLFHDGQPCRELGIAFVWINRYKERNRSEVSPLAEYADLDSLADALDA